ncbi:DUF4113 domain-containing protein [Mucilaginibacter aquariorum]|uniref:DUF4113 domain-containing protein n=1 Tax=Mucilaginibacter aquariorum TaxID=2967225 RepID=A0ABT1SZD5_9SPHI|nr:DUF4113 domain-containing protein [Mucilaginibacter aquariorum]MCQ6957715.1 DUF4113 domain-containing protein [Mucilaginibacter aquariorum]
MLTDLRHNSDGTQILFQVDTRQKEIEIIKKVDRLNRLNGGDTVRSASADWRMKQGNLSPKYTTRLSVIILIK